MRLWSAVPTRAGAPRARPGPETPCSPRYAYTYGYDAAGRINSFTDASATAPTSGTLTWDHDSNRLSYHSGAHNATFRADDSLNAIDAGTPLSYDPVGRLTNDGTNCYSYDGFDRKASALPVATCTTAGTGAAYSYDGLDRQRSHTETAATTTLHPDGLSAAIATETAPTTGIDTVYGLSPAGGPQAATTQTPLAPTTEYLLSDGQGNITTTTDTTGVVGCSARFDPFGNAAGHQSASNPCATGSSTTNNDIFYRGARLDTTSGQYQFGSRTYDPAKGAFLTPDNYRTAPASANLGLGTDPLTRNTYSYVNGDPVNLADPSGHFLEGLGSAISSAVARAVPMLKAQGQLLGQVNSVGSGRPATISAWPLVSMAAAYGKNSPWVASCCWAKPSATLSSVSRSCCTCGDALARQETTTATRPSAWLRA